VVFGLAASEPQETEADALLCELVSLLLGP